MDDTLFNKELSLLYDKTYEGNWDKFDDVRCLSVDGGDYLVGVFRHKDTHFSLGKNDAPHMRSDSTTFIAPLVNGELTGESIRIRATAEDDVFSQSDEIMQHSSATRIYIQKNYPDKLPRMYVNDDGEWVGEVMNDYSTVVKGFYDVADRNELLKATQNIRRHRFYKDVRSSTKVAQLCATFIQPNEIDTKVTEQAANPERNALRQQMRQDAFHIKSEHKDTDSARFLRRSGRRFYRPYEYHQHSDTAEH